MVCQIPAACATLALAPVTDSSLPVPGDGQDPSFINARWRLLSSPWEPFPSQPYCTLPKMDMFRLDLVTAGHRRPLTRRTTRPIQRIHPTQMLWPLRSSCLGCPPGRLTGGGAPSLSGFRPAGLKRGRRRWWGPQLQALRLGHLEAQLGWETSWGRCLGTFVSAKMMGADQHDSGILSLSSSSQPLSLLHPFRQMERTAPTRHILSRESAQHLVQARQTRL